MKAAIQLQDDVRSTLEAAVIEGNILRLTGQLERDLYSRTNKALEALGGKWNRAKGGHVFECDPRAAIETASQDAKVAHPNQHDFFRTARAVAEIACRKLDMGHGWLRTLEPSCGEADLIAPLLAAFGLPTQRRLVMVEKDPRRLAILRTEGFGGHVMEADFLTLSPADFAPFERIIANPPFHMGADAKHIGHALDFLAPGGRLVAIASAGFKGRAMKATKAVRDRIEAWGGAIEDLPEGSFKEAGTNVATVLITVDRPTA